ncbi:MAG TPA: tRNA lysidine(34) synthetase TilS [Rubrivivax sp.]|nr:tRNA lysidine(34) synthetase TilS [Rubrivivax sp.]
MRQRVAVAVSGGRDSTALWHASACAARGTGLEVVALHVHHGLLPEADSWVAHLQRQARRWAARGLPVALRWQRLQGAPQRGDSVEAWARRERYAALASMARAEGIGLVLLAHHRRDQAETFLLQALRGAGAAGLAGMPREALRDGIVWARPWLAQPREAVEAYVRRHRLGFIDDSSNEDRRLARNRLRREVWPALSQAFAQAESSLAASAGRAHEAAECLRALADIDAQHACSADGQLEVAAWSRLPLARRANLLRVWLAGVCGAAAPETLVQRLLSELPAAAAASAWPCTGGALRLHAGRLRLQPDDTARAPQPLVAMTIDLSRAGRIAVPEWRGSFELQPVHTHGVDPDRLRHCELRARRGGERFQRVGASPPRSLKKQFQAAGVPSWQRGGPLLYSAGELLFVPGLGIDVRCHAPRGSTMLGLRWLPDAPAPRPGRPVPRR